MAFNNAVDATQTGFQSITAGGVWNGRTLTAGTGINITNGDGIAGNPTIATVAPPAAAVAFSASKTANTANATGDGTVVTVVYDTDNFNVGGGYFSSGINAGKFIAPVTGDYHFVHTIALTNLAVGHTELQSRFNVNGTDLWIGETLNPAAAKELTSGSINTLCHAFISLTAGDTVISQVFVSGGAKTVTVSGSAVPGYSTNFGGELVSTPSSANFLTVAQQAFTANGTYTPTAGMQYCIIEMVGGGGAGGGSAATGGGQVSVGAGGGSAEYASGVFNAATIGVSQAVTIGAAGAGAAGVAGGNGGNTSVGALISAFGGSGGSLVAATATFGAANGGAGGTGGAGGNTRFNGVSGGPALASALGGGTINYGFPGGSGRFGSGATNSATGGGPGIAATGFGAGGSGAEAGAGTGAQAGGNGSAGYVLITEFI